MPHQEGEATRGNLDHWLGSWMLSWGLRYRLHTLSCKWQWPKRSLAHLVDVTFSTPCATWEYKNCNTTIGSTPHDSPRFALCRPRRHSSNSYSVVPPRFMGGRRLGWSGWCWRLEKRMVLCGRVKWGWIGVTEWAKVIGIDIDFKRQYSKEVCIY
jgi:hypothetical protein